MGINKRASVYYSTDANHKNRSNIKKNKIKNKKKLRWYFSAVFN